MSIINNIVNEFDIALKTLSNKKSGTGRAYPADSIQDNTDNLSQKEKNLSIQMMRVNLAGEVAAQALYRGQALVCKDQKIKDELKNLTNIAFQNDIFGAPTFVVNNNLFWGQDRLEYALDELNN